MRPSSSNRLNALLLTNPIAAMAQECGDSDPNQLVTMGWYVNVIAVDPVNSDRCGPPGGLVPLRRRGAELGPGVVLVDLAVPQLHPRRPARHDIPPRLERHHQPDALGCG